jgi:hypothetical protein
VDFEPTPEGRFVLVKAGKKQAARIAGRFERIRGTMKSDLTTDEIMALLRGGPGEI